jgi:lysine-N-methylase
MNNPSLRRIALLETFTCLGSACEDTCCQGWDMQVDGATQQLYASKAPELLDSITEDSTGCVMKRDETADRCIKLDGENLCGIHKQYGDAFLSDACHFYPRVTRALGDAKVMTAVLSCPEIVRLALAQDEGSSLLAIEAPARMQRDVANSLPAGLSEQQAVAVHEAFLQAAGDATAKPERILMRMVSAAGSLSRVDVKSWPEAAAFYLAHADQRLPAPEPVETDPFFLLQALGGIVSATRKPERPRLTATIASIERALNTCFDWQTRAINTKPDSIERARSAAIFWNTHCAAHFAPILRRWLAMQISTALFPFAGFGNTILERATIIGVRFATLRLALMSACFEQSQVIPQEDTVRIIQSLARVLDHLADPTLSMQIYTETGWIHERRMRALVGDA